MLAYVFWHRPRPEVEAAEYEGAQRDFHAALETPSACFRLAELPFGNRYGGYGYEDWYLLEDWADLGELNSTAVDVARGPRHDRAAAMAATGWGGVYELVRGVSTIPEGVEWLDKPRGKPSPEFVASLPHESVWRRQLVLGPAPELCGVAPVSSGRVQLAR